MAHAMRVFFIIGTSGSMAGSKITAVNMGMREMLPEITDISDASGVKKKIMVTMSFLDELKEETKWI